VPGRVFPYIITNYERELNKKNPRTNSKAKQSESTTIRNQDGFCVQFTCKELEKEKTTDREKKWKIPIQ
jgi:hypothetical protein